jgi:phasin family protein
MIKSFEEFQTLSKDGFEAYVASANALSKGMQNFAQQAAEYSRRSFEQTSQAYEKVTAAKSLEKALEVQQGFAKEAYETFVAQMSKFGELYTATAQEAYKPFEASFQAFGFKSTAK